MNPRLKTVMILPQNSQLVPGAKSDKSVVQNTEK